MEEAVEGCWIGHRARLPALAGSDIGSVYAPPVQSTTTLTFQRTQVETVLEVSLRPSGWNVICEKGGIRRVLMNLIGNSSVRIIPIDKLEIGDNKRNTYAPKVWTDVVITSSE